MYLGSVGAYLSSLGTVMHKTNAKDIAMGIVIIYPFMDLENRGAWAGLPYFSISLSLNIILTLMTVLRLVLHGRNIRAATGSPAGISGLYNTIATMLIESSALFAVSSVLYIGLLAGKNEVMDMFSPIIYETQVRVFPPWQSSDRLSDVTEDCAGHRPIAHHSTSCQQECVNQ